MQALHIHDAKDVLDKLGKDPTKFTTPDDAMYKDLLINVKRPQQKLKRDGTHLFLRQKLGSQNGLAKLHLPQI